MNKSAHSMTNIIRRITPAPVVDAYRKIRYGKTWYEPEGKSVKKVFTDIYKRRLWGESDSHTPFCSGPGSDEGVAIPYVKAVQGFIAEHKIPTVVDLGCGDFRVGSLLAQPSFTYYGVDLVKDLIDFNIRQYAAPHIKFGCRDIIHDDLPAADLCLIRQVLQHLSNAQIQQILNQCSKYPFLIVTEHLPDPSQQWQPNKDISHGIETRVDRGSGLVLDQPPFSSHIQKVLCEVQQPDNTIIQTVLIANKDSRN